MSSGDSAPWWEEILASCDLLEIDSLVGEPKTIPAEVALEKIRTFVYGLSVQIDGKPASHRDLADILAGVSIGLAQQELRPKAVEEWADNIARSARAEKSGYLQLTTEAREAASELGALNWFGEGNDYPSDREAARLCKDVAVGLCSSLSAIVLAQLLQHVLGDLIEHHKDERADLISSTENLINELCHAAGIEVVNLNRSN